MGGGVDLSNGSRKAGDVERLLAPRFDIWRAHVEAMASSRMAGLINWANVPFDWIGPWEARTPKEDVVLALIDAALDAVEVLTEDEAPAL